MMKKFIIAVCTLTVLASFAFGGTESYSSGKEMKQTAVQQAPCPTWYRDTEWNISLWGTYAFTGNDWRNDRYLGVDHAWGGGIDAKYFFHRYFGVGLEGYGVALNNNHGTFFNVNGNRNESGAAGAAIGTLTFRYPIPCSRFAPYFFAGAGAIFGGEGQASVIVNDEQVTAVNNGSETRAVGQFGGGIEVRFTPTIGWMNDFSWNVVGGRNNNFGQVRSGVTFAF
ncbi:MAG: hypothetical protein DMF04_00800 [Verrucomicrobia bacterium]|nr:MAG: hypothetical protein DMF04_00800 [Verrucomicrobiota bacterium]